MKILHTSDWHLGQSFMGKSREAEHKAFLAWLLQTIQEHSITTLIVAGDIFDTGTPPNYALELYYTFLKECSQLCTNIIVIAGNHDSIATLKASKELLGALHIDVITTGDTEESELVELYEQGELCAIVCGVPYLRDYVVRESLAGETLHEKEHSLTQGIEAHYKKVHEEALVLRGNLDVPIVATGHLTTVGATRSESEREIYIGGTLNVESSFLSKLFDYVALGHLHINQRVGCESVRYSGSPIPLSFSEAGQQKRVNVVSWSKGVLEVEELVIPLYRELFLSKGNLEKVLADLESVESTSTWIEVHLKDENPFYANQQIRARAEELGLSILALKVEVLEQKLQGEDFHVISLDELTPQEVFEKRLEKELLKDEAFEKQLSTTFSQVVEELHNR